MSLSKASNAPRHQSAGHGAIETNEPAGLELLELDNDDDERLAALSSPIKGGKRLTSTVCHR
jgi:hypothetical protein